MKLLALAGAVAALAAPAKLDVGEWTYGLAAANGSLWAGGLAIGDVLRVDPASGRVVGRVNIGARVFNLAAAPGAVWAVANISGTVSRVDARTGDVTATVRVGNEPYDVEWGFGSAWVSNAGDGTVSRITGRKIVRTIDVGVEPNGLAAAGGYIWVGDHTAGRLVRIDPRTNRVTARLRLAGADWITAYRGSLYVSQETDRVTRVDMRTLEVLGRVRTARNPLGSAIVGGRLWVPCIDANVVLVVDPRTMRVVDRKPGGASPIVVLPAFGHVWLSHTTGTSIWRF
jgi:DNA-binding beta-propeller fold protein YncE